MDNSDFRRGRPTVHKKWNEPTAILAGDVMIGHCIKLLPSPKESSRSYEILQTFNNGLIEVCEGQALDMLYGERQDVSLEDYLLMIRKKTSLMLETAALIGGHSAEGSEAELEALRNYAENLGLAFQIQDDLLDLTADEAALGKKIGKDIVEGKKTYLIILANAKVKEEADKSLLTSFYENNGLPYEQVEKIKEMMDRLGILEETRNEAQRYFEKAKEYLNLLNNNGYVEALRELADSLNDRKK
jgi:geranylgeranyl pyrophosphate synthase